MGRLIFWTIKSPPYLASVDIMQEVLIMVFCIGKDNPTSMNNRIESINKPIQFLYNR